MIGLIDKQYPVHSTWIRRDFGTLVVIVGYTEYGIVLSDGIIPQELAMYLLVPLLQAN